MNFFFAAGRHPLQGHAQFHLDVRAGHRPGPAAVEEVLERSAAKPEIEVEAAEQIFEIDAAEQVLSTESSHARKTARIVFGPLFRIGEHRIGFGDFLEALLGARLFVAVRMILQGELAESVFDGFRVGVARNAKHLVVIALSG